MKKIHAILLPAVVIVAITGFSFMLLSSDGENVGQASASAEILEQGCAENVTMKSSTRSGGAFVATNVFYSEHSMKNITTNLSSAKYEKGTLFDIKLQPQVSKLSDSDVASECSGKYAVRYRVTVELPDVDNAITTISYNGSIQNCGAWTGSGEYCRAQNISSLRN